MDHRAVGRGYSAESAVQSRTAWNHSTLRTQPGADRCAGEWQRSAIIEQPSALRAAMELRYPAPIPRQHAVGRSLRWVQGHSFANARPKLEPNAGQVSTYGRGGQRSGLKSDHLPDNARQQSIRWEL